MTDPGFTTYDRDKESGLDYAMNRMYASNMGRMTSPDKGRMMLNLPSTLNRYTYGSSDPINHVDPSGNEWRLTWALVTPRQNIEYLDGLIGFGALDGVCAGIGGFSAGGGGIHVDGGDVWVACNVWGADLSPSTGYTSEETGVAGGGEIETQAPPPDRRSAGTPECDPVVLAAMKSAWARTANGTSRVEAGFAVFQSTTGRFTVSVILYSNTADRIELPDFPVKPVAVFHVHPNVGKPEPSDADIRVANQRNFSVYSFGVGGLWKYNRNDISTGKLEPKQLTDGKEWEKPCP